LFGIKAPLADTTGAEGEVNVGVDFDLRMRTIFLILLRKKMRTLILRTRQIK
jgi:hypothetical protein